METIVPLEIIVLGDETIVTNYPNDLLVLQKFGIIYTNLFNNMFHLILPSYISYDDYNLSHFELCKYSSCNETLVMKYLTNGAIPETILMKASTSANTESMHCDNINFL